MTRRDTPLLLTLLSPVFLAFLGCGRPATIDDCTRVVEKNVEVQMRKSNITDPEEIAREKARVRVSLSDKIAQCPGRRVTDGMMRCVEHAGTSEEIDKCMRRLF